MSEMEPRSPTPATQSLKLATPIQRLQQRGTQPVGVVNVQRFEARFAQVPGWIVQRSALLEQLQTRYSNDADSAGDSTELALAAPSKPVEREPVTLPPPVTPSTSAIARAMPIPASASQATLPLAISRPSVPLVQAKPTNSANSVIASSSSAASAAPLATANAPGVTQSSHAMDSALQPLPLPSPVPTGYPPGSPELPPSQPSPLHPVSVLPSPATVLDSPAPLLLKRDDTRTTPDRSSSVVSDAGSQAAISNIESAMTEATKPSSEDIHLSPIVQRSMAPTIGITHSSAAPMVQRSPTPESPIDSSDARSITTAEQRARTAENLPLAQQNSPASTPVSSTDRLASSVNSNAPPIARVITPLNPGTVQARSITTEATSSSLPFVSGRSTAPVMQRPFNSPTESKPQPVSLAVAPGIPISPVADRPNVIWRQSAPATRSDSPASAASTGFPLAIQTIPGQPPMLSRYTDSSTTSPELASSMSIGSEQPLLSASDPGPGVNVAQLAEQVSRILHHKLTIERERRGMNLWS